MRFGYIEDCTLAHAYKGEIRFRQEDHLGQCNHACCEACGLFYVRRWVDRHRLKGAVIRDETWLLSLLWPGIKNHSGSHIEVIKFLDAVQKVREHFEDGVWGRLDGWAGVVHYSSVPRGGSGFFQPHLHLAFLPGKSLLAFRSIRRLWKTFGGKSEWYLPKNGLEGFFAYANKHPFKGFNRYEKVELHSRVFQAVERHRQLPSAPRFLGGRALSGHGFRRLRARARIEPQIEERGIFAMTRDPDFKHHLYCPSVRCVCPVDSCPECCAFGKKIKHHGRTAAGTPRWKCKRCSTTWCPTAVFAAEKSLSHERFLDRHIRNARKNGDTIQQIAASEGISKSRVQQALKRRKKATDSQHGAIA